jgi:hypothetical protein
MDQALQSKSEIMKYVKDLFVYLRRALTSINARNATQGIQSPIQPKKVTKLALATDGGRAPFCHGLRKAVRVGWLPRLAA